MSIKNIYEIFEEFQKAETIDDKKRVLIKHWNIDLQTVLQATFHPEVHFAIDRVPLYKPSDMPIGMGWSGMHQELKKVYLYQKDHPKRPPNLTEKRMYEILAMALESLEAKEAIVFMNMLLKDLKVPNLDYKLVKDIAPFLLP